MGLAAGQARGHRGQQVLDAQHRGQLSNLGPRPLRCGRRVAQVVPDGQVREQARILAQQADPPLPGRQVDQRRGGRGQDPVAQMDPGVARLDQARDSLQQRRLARAGGPEQRQPLTRCHLQCRAHGELPAVNRYVGVQHGRSRCRRPAAAAGRPPAGPGHTAAPKPGRSPAVSYISATVSRPGGRR